MKYIDSLLAQNQKLSVFMKLTTFTDKNDTIAWINEVLQF